ncbi:MAG: alpha-galactosidase [Candidatus Hydrogenedentes bacterium]|nr:alpha-galactosidase [Candidatus Hydrogenedentota bacterium]
MKPVRIAIVGAGSRSFGPSTVRDVLLSEALAKKGIDLRLMDIVPEHLPEVENYARQVVGQLKREARISKTMDLEAAIEGADFVVSAIEVNRWRYWSQDFHIPRKHGFRQVFGENGGPGSLFHALRNIGPTLRIAETMERRCPKALLLNFTNPEHKVCEAVSRLTSIQVVGLCHGVFMGRRQIAQLLEMPVEDLDTAACGINHFTWFQRIRHRHTGEDLYPKLRAVERDGDWLAEWPEIGLGRILFRRFGLWPSPAANHYGEYIRWAEEFVPPELQYFYDPADGHPWETGVIPEFVYSLSGDRTTRPWRKPPPEPSRLEDAPLKSSGELAVPIMESLSCGIRHHLAAVNVPNRGAIPNLPDDLVVEVPAEADAGGLHPHRMEPLPEAIAALIRVQASIHKLLVEAYAERSKDKLLQAMLLDPTVDSYRRAVECVDEMLRLQWELLPNFDGKDHKDNNDSKD